MKMTFNVEDLESLLLHNADFRRRTAEALYIELFPPGPFKEDLEKDLQARFPHNKIAQIKEVRDMSKDFTNIQWHSLGLAPNSNGVMGLADAKKLVETWYK